jgi:hypothetical protein
MADCPFKHDGIDRLSGVPVCPTSELPQVCTCGATLTYAPVVTFVNQVRTYRDGNAYYNEDGEVVMERDEVVR